jgi:tripartite ATP-independent transporter DctM subunit
VVEKALVAGLVPGTVLIVLLGIYGAMVGVKAKVPRQKFDFKEALRTLWVAKWEAVIPFVLVGGIISGLLRIHEASAFTAVYVLFIELFVYRDITMRKDLPRIVIESMTLVGAILTIMATAIGFTGWMIQAQIPMQLLEWMESFVHSKYVFLFMLNVFLVFVGMLMDIFSAIVVVVPLILPMAYAYDIDPYHLAIVFLLNLEIGYLTPPVGLNLFISGIRFGRSIMYVTRTILPFIAILFGALALVTYIPEITTWLPNKMSVQDEVKSLGGGFMAADSFDDDEGMDLDDDWDDEDWDDEDEVDGGPDGGVDGGDAGEGGVDDEDDVDEDDMYDDDDMIAPDDPDDPALQ